MAGLTSAQKRGLAAGAMSLVVPGLGQIVYRQFVVGVFWLILTPVFWYSTKFLLGWVAHVMAAASAYWAVQRQYDTGPHRKRKHR
ncbi:MAG: hypothetical protein NTY02_19540 [Acidobacteria bacterium]|nr:hypothetical protein [Acidobacteriota bacterium]